MVCVQRTPVVIKEFHMPDSPEHFGFAKLLVVDLEKSAAFYTDVFGLKETTRIQSEIAGRELEEILFNPTGDGAATFVLLKFLDATTPSSNELILGFLTSDIDALIDRAIAAGGSVLREAQDYSHLGVKVAFINDLEGHLIEVVQQMA
jgi:predicted enzyme related to lactoylglutathione lyase